MLCCARGTNSLKSSLTLCKLNNSVFILLLLQPAAVTIMYPPYRFIPGTSANDFHYQGYLLEDLVRWNKAHSLTAIQDEHG